MDTYLNDELTEALLTKDSSGLIHMIRNNKVRDLQILYSMLSRRNDSFEILRKHLSEHIISEGSKLIEDEKLKNEELVVKLIDLNCKITNIMH